MNVTDFLCKFERELDGSKDAFILNFAHTEMSFCDWIAYLIAWNEWATTEECEDYYDEMFYPFADDEEYDGDQD